MILICSQSFHPEPTEAASIGLKMARMMVERGHEVVVVTETEAKSNNATTKESFPIFYNPSPQQLKALFKESDSVFGNHLSFGLLRPLLFSMRKPHCVLLQDHLQKSFARFVFQSKVFKTDRVYAGSKHLADYYKLGDRIIRNGYDADIFKSNSLDESRKFDFLFAGSLTKESGVDLVIDAMHLLPPNCTCVIVGDGPERESIEEVAPSNVQLLGAMEAPYKAELMRQSKWVILPDRVKPTSSTIAVEAIACGARVIAANHGSLPEAVGPCGVFFSPNKVQSLLMTMRKAFERVSLLGYTEKERENHLKQFSLDLQVDSILQVLNR